MPSIITKRLSNERKLLIVALFLVASSFVGTLTGAGFVWEVVTILGLFVFFVSFVFFVINVGFTETMFYIYLLLFILFIADYFNFSATGIPTHIFLIPVLLLLLIHRRLRTVDIGELRYENLLSKQFVTLAFLSVPLSLSIIVSQDKVASSLAVAELVIYFLSYYTFCRLVNNYSIWKRVIFLFVFSVFIVSIIGIYQYYFFPVRFYRLASSTERGPNQLAFIIQITTFIFFVGLIYNQKPKIKFLYLVIFFLSALALVLTFSRAAWLSLLIEIFLFFAISLDIVNIKFTIKLFASIFFFVFFTLFLLSLNPNLMVFDSPAFSRFTERSLDSNNSRSLRLKSNLREIVKSPLLGHGLGLGSSQNAHNSYLAIWSGSGVFAFSFVVLFLGLNFRDIWQVREYMNQEYLWGNILFAVYIALLVKLFISNYFFSSIFWVLMAFQGAAINIYEQKSIMKTG